MREIKAVRISSIVLIHILLTPLEAAVAPSLLQNAPSLTSLDELAPLVAPVPEIANTYAGDSCPIHCPSSGASEPSILKYLEREPHKYKVESSTFIHSPTSLKGEGTQLHYVANIDITAENRCSYVLRVLNIKISGVGINEKTVPSLSQYPVKFSWNNGQLDKLCLHEHETESDANFKRSIISNLQISSYGNVFTRSVPTEGSTSYETDVYGRCAVTIESIQEQDGSWVIRKNKNLANCKYRQGYDFAVNTGFHHSDNGQMINPFVKAALNSIIRIDKNMIKSVSVEEEYSYQPLSNYADSLTRVSVTTKISHVGPGKIPPVLNTPNMVSASLLFDNVKNKEEKVLVTTIVTAVQEASQEIDGVVPKNGASDFNKLVNILQRAGKEPILLTHDQIKGGTGVKNPQKALNVFWDAMIFAASPATVEAASTLMESGAMPENKISDFLASLSFVKHPTDQTLSTISNLLNEPTVSTDRYLAVGALTRRYVSNNPNKNTDGLVRVVEKLAEPIKSMGTCETAQEQDMVISSLKGLRNTQFVTPGVSEMVTNCAMNRKLPYRVRVAALQAIMEFPDTKNIEAALEILKNIEEDAELRIQAFLICTNSPTPQMAETVKQLLDNMLSDQVGSYITSYIRNLRSTTNPGKESLKQYFGNIESKKKFPSDFRQYSKNTEFSQFFSMLNLGYSGESNVIFSRESYLPRSTSLNLDVNLFGNTLNLFELGGRFENIEYLIERIAGPKSYVNTKTAEEVADDFSNSARNYLGDVARQAAILKRSTRDLENMRMKLTESQTNHSAADKYMDIDFNLKMFNSEVLWKAYHVDKDNVASGQYLESLFLKIREAIEDAKNLNVDFKKHYRCPLISNNIVYYPTCSGHPIKIKTNAAGVISFKMAANVDVMKMINTPKSSELKFSIIPSADLQIDAVLEIDASAFSVGLKATSSLRTATGMNIELDMLNGRGLDLRFGLPVKEQDIFTVETKAFATVQEQGQPLLEQQLKPTGQRYEYSRSFDQLVRIAGVSFHVDISSPSFKYIPTFCPGRFSIRMRNEDNDLKYYQAKFFYENEEEGNKSLEIMFDTPGSSINRKIAILAQANKSQNTYLFKFDGWTKHFLAEAIEVNKETEILYNLKINNDNNMYDMKVGATINQEGSSTIYKPFMDFSMPISDRHASLNQVRLTPKQVPKLFDIDGVIVLETEATRPEYKKYEFKQLGLISPLGKLVFNGSILKDRELPEYSTDLTATYGQGRSITVQAGYKETRETKESRRSKKKKQQKEEELVTTAYAAFMPSQWPLYSFKYELNQVQKAKGMTRNMSLTNGPDLNSALMTMSSNENYYWYYNPKTQQLQSLGTSVGVSYPLWRLEGSAMVRQKNNNYYQGAGQLKMDKTNIELNSSVSLPIDKPGNVVVALETKLNNRNLNLEAVREVVGEDQSHITINVKTVPEKHILVVMPMTHRLKEQDVMLKASPEITILPDNTQYKYELGFLNTQGKKGVHIVAYPNKERSFELKAGYNNDGNKINGSGVLFMKNNVDGTLRFRKDQSRLKGDLNLNMIKMDRQMDGKLDMTIKDQNYKGYAELLWDASKDASQKIRIDTDTTIASDNINISSVNVIRVADYVFQTDGNVAVKDDISKRVMEGDVNFQFPEGFAFGGKLNSARGFVDTLVNHDLTVDTYYTKGKVYMTSNYSLHAKNVDLSATIFDVESSLSVATSKIRSAKLSLDAKRSLGNGLWSTLGKLQLDGSLVPKSVGLEGGFEYPDTNRKPNEVNVERSLPRGSGYVAGNLGEDYAASTSASLTGNELDAKLNFKVPVEEKSFTFEWNTTTSLDIVPSKSINVSTNNNARWNAVNFVNCSANLELFPKNGKAYLDWASTGVSKRTMNVIYNYDTERKEGLKGPYCQANIQLTAGKKSAYCNVLTELSKDLLTKSIALSGNTPVSGDFDIRATSKIEDNGHVWFNDLSLNSNNKKWYMVTSVNIVPTKPELYLQFTSPEGDSKLALKFEELKSNHWNGSAEIVWQLGGEGYVTASGELKIDSVDDILVRAKCDAPVFHINNFSLSARNEAVENGKKLAFNVKTESGSQYSGVIPYTYRKDKYKVQFEGSGIIKIDNENVPITFKIARSQLTEAKNGESGSSNNLYINYDNKKYIIDVVGKFTDKVFLAKRDIRVGDELYRMMVQYNAKLMDASDYEKIFVIHIDLKPHLLNGETFEVKHKTTRSLSNTEEFLTIQWSPTKKLDYNAYSNNGKSGFVLNLPQRQIAGEAVYSYKLESSSGDVSLTGTVWFDKTRDENQKTKVAIGTEYKIPEKEHNIVIRSSAEVQIPTLAKSLAVSSGLLLSPFDEKTVVVKGTLDIFKKEEEKIDITYQIFKEKKDQGFAMSDMLKVESQGQKMDTELFRSLIICSDHLEYHIGLSYLDFQGRTRVSAGDFDMRLSSITSKIQIMDEITFNGTSQVGFTRRSVLFTNDFDVMGHRYGNVITLNTDPRIVAVLEWKDIGQKAEINASFVYEQFIDITVKLLDRGPVASFTLFLTDDNKFMTSETRLFIEEADALLDNGLGDMNALIEKGKTAVKSVTDDISKQMLYRKKRYQNASINMKPVIRSANDYFAALKEELNDDLADSPNMKKIVNSISDFVFTIVQQMSNFFGEWIDGYNAFLEKLAEYCDTIMLQIKSRLQGSSNETALMLRDLLSRANKLTKELLAYVKANQAKWKQAFTSLNESVRDTVKIIYDVIDKVAQDTREIAQKTIEYIRSLPVTSYVKEKLDQMKDSETIRYVWSTVNQMAANLRESLPTPELKTLYDTIMSAIDKIVNNKEFDARTEIKNIAKQIMECLRSFYNTAYDSNYLRDISDNLPQISLSSFRSIPNVWSSTMSTLNSVRETGMPDMREILERYSVGSANPLNLIPPFKKVGVIVNGNQVVTMNGNYYSIPGDGQYMLAAEFETFSFTVAAEIKNGQLTSLAASSTSQMIEIYPDSGPKLDGKLVTDFPVYGNGLYAVRTPNTIEIYIDNSVRITCTPDLDLVVVQISGFYHNRVQGLLGSVNPDSYTDFLTPEKKVAKDVSAFISSYRFNEGQTPAIVAKFEGGNTPECTEMFNGKSVLRNGFSFVKANPFRDMCEQMVAVQSTPADKVEAACKVGRVFSLVSSYYGYYLTLPPYCSKCSIENASLPFGKVVNVHTPGKSADIILVLEKVKDNEAIYKELMFKAFRSIKSALKTKGISNVDFLLVGYGPEDPVASLHTTNGKLSLSNKTKIQFSESSKSEPTTNLGKFVRNTKYFLGMYGARQALEVANDYPFRPEAVKAVIHLKASNDEVTSLDQYDLYNTFANAIVSLNIVTNKIPFFLVAPTESFIATTENYNTEIFGFDFNNMYTADGPTPFNVSMADKLKYFHQHKSSVVLPLATNGAVFNTSIFSQSAANVRSQLVSVFADTVSSSLVSSDRYSACTCTYREGVYSEVKCSAINAANAA